MVKPEVNPKNQKKNKSAEPVAKTAKDTKVVLINSNHFSALKPDSPKETTSKDGNFSLSHFPELGNGGRSEAAFNSPWNTRKWNEPFPKLGNHFDGLAAVDDSTALSETSLAADIVNSKPDAQAMNKLKRSRRPISLDLTSIIKAKNKKTQFKTTSTDFKHRKLRSVDKLSGNPLDSSMPIRKRGKVRETKKIKLSPLKTAIIKDRILKMIKKRIADGEAVNLDEIDFKEELKNYLVHTRKENQLSISQAAVSLSKRSVPVVASEEKKLWFHQKFRSYCENILTPELNAATKELIKNLVALQDRAFARDPIRARVRKRFVVGFREAAKYLKLKSVKLLIIAPDLETSASDGALHNFIQDLKQQAISENVPYIFSLDRRKLGYCSLRKVPVSAFTILNYEGIETLFEITLKEYYKARNIFLENFVDGKGVDSNEVSEIFSNLSVDASD